MSGEYQGGHYWGRYFGGSNSPANPGPVSGNYQGGRYFRPYFGNAASVPPAAPADPFDYQLEQFLSGQLGYPVYPLYRSQAVPLPAMTYAMVSRERPHKLKGSSGMAVSTYHITAWSNSFADTAIMGGTLFDALDSFSGAMGSATVRSAISGDEVALYNAPVNDKSRGVHQRVCIYRITHLEPVSRPTRSRGG